jgi:hypothetical protein
MGRVVSVTPRPCFTPGRGAQYQFDKRLCGPHTGYGHRLGGTNPGTQVVQ